VAEASTPTMTPTAIPAKPQCLELAISWLSPRIADRRDVRCSASAGTDPSAGHRIRREI
jgi:hypothetical protein